MDTMSMHIAVCGLTNFQRVLYKAGKTNSQQKAVIEYRQKQKQRGALTVSYNLLLFDKPFENVPNIHNEYILQLYV